MRNSDFTFLPFVFFVSFATRFSRTRPKDHRKGFIMLRQESIPSNCQVCEEFLQGYHELLQRVSVSALYNSNVRRVEYSDRRGERFVEECKFLWCSVLYKSVKVPGVLSFPSPFLSSLSADQADHFKGFSPEL